MKILMVCLGNICRSPLAEGILKSKLPENFIVDSAGTSAFHKGEIPDERAISIAKEQGIDISNQRSRPLQIWDFDEFDRIYCMDKSNLSNVLSMAENDRQKEKVSLILDILEDSISEVPDPYYSGKESFEKVYQLLDRACTAIASELLSES
ncbi:low molecular weight protein-tyrosine-phosphatase [Bergeyella cardium]|uniref:protein-tyrosine-phosphatase n=1 Tax=Bergeyella cardium TaxID=1585976 RepID=A0A6P1QW14_9FLAO|nr:low molecular weight protein-tyrosine-phosphatase [Bergeyella cardium]QHN65965.1 low molecular weight phosphotyrosine protein phosphatase [Bergeyella cardium]WHE33569.1 low molecular weight phosphotyrosine protein phosphatase [Bergeyella cardium]WHF60219.1 low molecular weight phosphotyrosine protein phosphatase [Bergeyella cardium]